MKAMKAEKADERRRYYRHPIEVPILLSDFQDELFDNELQCQDVSEGGLCIRWGEKLEQGRDVKVVIPIQNKLFEMKARVVYSRRNAKDGLYHTGLAFEDATSHFRAKLAEEVIQMARYREKISKKHKRDVTEEEAAALWIQRRGKEFAKLFEKRKQPA